MSFWGVLWWLEFVFTGELEIGSTACSYDIYLGYKGVGLFPR